MTELLVSIVLFVIFIIHFVYSKNYSPLKDEKWFFVLVVTITFLTPWMSHLWHILYGEDRIKCEEAKDEAFGWTPCFEPTWNTFVNTYEITLVIENLFFVGLGYYVLYTLFKKYWWRNLFVFGLNTVLLTTAIILMFASPMFLDDYEDIFNYTGFIVSLIMWFAVEIYLRCPYFGYNAIDTN
tara:strand:- start:742 stop:1287 length:546 start_codon:yes stop_codon:yes gene_type:complete